MKKYAVLLTWHQNTSNRGTWGYCSDFGQGLSWQRALSVKKQWCEEEANYPIPYMEKVSDCGDCTVSIIDFDPKKDAELSKYHCSNIY